MVYSPQQMATGFRKKKNRLAPVIQEQARQGLATKQVTTDKANQQAKEEWEFEKQSQQESLALQRQANEQAKKQAEMQETMGWINTGINVASNAGSIIDLISSIF